MLTVIEFLILNAELTVTIPFAPWLSWQMVTRKMETT
jgi:hypothetical protein